MCSPALPKFLGKDSAVPLRQDSLRAPVLLLPMQRAQLGVGTARAQKSLALDMAVCPLPVTAATVVPGAGRTTAR